VESIQAENNAYTYSQIREKWKGRSGSTKKLSDATIRRILVEFDYTTKNLEVEPVGRNTPEAIEIRKQYCVMAARWDMGELVYIDEKGFNLHQHRRRGATWGKRRNSGAKRKMFAVV